jgi:hypothetical protein
MKNWKPIKDWQKKSLVWSESRQASHTAATAFSATLRQLSLVGVGIIWLFKIGDYPILFFNDHLVWALALFVFTFILDIMQGLYGIVSNHYIYKWLERNNPGQDLSAEDANITKEITGIRHFWVFAPGWIFLYGKIGTVIWGYIFIARYIYPLLYSTYAPV